MDLTNLLQVLAVSHALVHRGCKVCLQEKQEVRLHLGYMMVGQEHVILARRTWIQGIFMLCVPASVLLVLQT